MFLRGHGLKAPVIVDTSARSDVRVDALEAAACCVPRTDFIPPPPPPPPTAEGGDLQPDQIIIEPQNSAQGQPWKIDTLQSYSGQQVSPGEIRWLTKTGLQLLPCGLVCPPVLQNVFSVWGQSVKTIRVVRYDPGLTPAEIRHEVQKTWLGIWMLDSPERSVWNIEALLEYDDGKRATMLIGGDNVEVKDRDGDCGFIRLWPAVY